MLHDRRVHCLVFTKHETVTVWKSKMHVKEFSVYDRIRWVLKDSYSIKEFSECVMKEFSKYERIQGI